MNKFKNNNNLTFLLIHQIPLLLIEQENHPLRKYKQLIKNKGISSNSNNSKIQYKIKSKLLKNSQEKAVHISSINNKISSNNGLMTSNYL